MKRMTATLVCLYIFIILAVIYDQVTKGILSRLREAEKPTSPFGLVRANKPSSHDKNATNKHAHDEHVNDEHARAHGIDIIFVHGLGSNPDTTWGPKDSNWVNSFLPDDIPATFYKNIRIFFYNYDSYYKRDAPQGRLRTYGENLLSHIKSEIRETKEERTRKLLFVGHSYGGLVIKQALVQAKNLERFANIFEYTKAILFLGTPHRGSHFSARGSFAARLLQPLGSNPLLLEEVAYDSFPLQDLHTDFENVVDESLQVVNFYERRKTRILRIWFYQWEEMCVPEQSARYGKTESIGFDVDHSGLNKFESRNENYKSILGKLLETITPIVLQSQHRVYSVPIATVQSYTERQKLSTEIAEKMHVHHQKASVPHAVAIHGLGGTGKTQLVLKYVEDNKDKYNPILWIDAKDEESMLSSFERCASELQLSVDQTQTQGSNLLDSPTVQAVRRWLHARKETDDAWLVIIDSADDVSWGMKKVLPQGSRGNIIITSQDNQSWQLVDGGCEKVYVDTMEPLEARALLLRRLGWELDPVPQDIQDDCDKITQQLGYLALAIDLVGAYIHNDPDQRQALRRYPATYEKHRDDLLQSEEFRGLLQSDKTLWTVWETTLGKIKERYPKLRPDLVLAFLARFSGAVVQDELIRLVSLAMPKVCERVYGGAVELPSWLNQTLTVDEGVWDDYYYQESLKVLFRYSLLQRTEGEWPGVSMHGLVQWRTRKYEEKQPWGKWHLLAVLAGCVQLSKDKAGPEFRRELVTHVPALGETYLEKLNVEDNKKEFIWGTANSVLFYERRWKEAEELGVQVMEIRKRVLGEEHHKTLTSMNNLALTYQNQGRWKEAEELGVQVMETRMRVSGEEHPSTLNSISNLALTYQNQGRWKEAEELGVQVMETRKRVLGEEHPSTLTCMGNLAFTLNDQGRTAEAILLIENFLRVGKRVLGPRHPKILSSSRALDEWRLKKISAVE